MTGKKAFERLSSAVRPVNYSLSLQPDLTAFEFRGSEQIHVEVNEITKKISINCADIEVQKVTYQAEEAAIISNGTISYDADDEKVSFIFDEEIQIGEGTLSIEFTGKLNDKMKGFYRSKYTTPSGKERYAAVTQFEPTDARRAFPCWDEPAIKATFDITFIVPNDRVALSNMPVLKEEDFGGDTNLKILTYQRTPIMSTYLLAFVVGEYDYVEDRDEDGVLVRVYTPVGKQVQGKFALDVAIKTLPFYKNYFKISYPLPKMDLIAISDFAAGAMENWGLVTYRETALLVDPENSSAKVKQWVALVVGHELAHQWFGNLVTMEWWTHLWLNEGFASWIEYLCVDYCFPEYDIWTQFVNQDMGRALELDALDNSHPIEVAVGHPSEIDEIFDAISYSKGASVIRMLHSYIGDDAFKRGMNAYLEKFKYKNAITEDLWQALEKASGKPVEAVMQTWTKQMGFPVLKVSQSQNGSDRVLQISQEKFCANGKKAVGSYEWLVPITVSTVKSPNEPVETALVEKDNISITVPDLEEGDWVKLNSGTVGVYRVQYSSEMLHQLIPALRTGTLQPRDRLGLQSDLFALARAGLLSTVDVLKCAEEFKNEEDFTVWTDLSINLSSVATILQPTDFYPLFQKFTLDLYQEIMKKKGWNAAEGESHLNAMLRELVITKLGYNGDKAVVNEALQRFEEHYTGSKTLSADLRAAVYITVLANGDREIFNKMLQLYDKADSQEEQTRISRAMGSVRQEELINEVLNFAVSEKVRSQDSVFVIAGVTRSYAGKELAWKFVQDNWQMLFERYTGGFLIARLVKTTTEHFTTTERAAEIEKFFTEHPVPAAQRTIQQSCENIGLNARWLERDSRDIKEYLQSRK